MKSTIINILEDINIKSGNLIAISDSNLNLSIKNITNPNVESIVFVSSELPNTKLLSNFNDYKKNILNISLLNSSILLGPYFINNKLCISNTINKLLNNIDNSSPLTEEYTTTEHLELVLLNIIYLLLKSTVNKNFAYLINYEKNPITIKKITVN